MRALAIAAKDAPPAVMDVPDPAPAADQVRVAVEVASVNGFDLSIAAGRVWDSMAHTFPVVLGRDFVGTVDAVGTDVDGVRVGDRVAGLIVGASLGPGALGDYATTAADRVTAVPDGVSSIDAAAVGLAGVAALDTVDALDPAAGDTVLVSGATGGVGSVAVQLASARGASVMATARPGDEEAFVRSLGAAYAVDYTGDLAVAVRAIAAGGVDSALHAAGDPVGLAALVRAGGRLVSLLGATPEQVGRDDITVTSVVARSTADKLARLLAQVAAGALRVQVSVTVPLERATDALAAFRNGTLGKVLVVR